MKKVLIVEDNPDLRLLTKNTLKIIKLEVIEARDGLIGFNLAKEHRPDLIISDIDMPELNGFSLLNKLKKDSVTADIPFIFLTGQVDENSRDCAFQLGADSYISKPFKIEDFLTVVALYLDLNINS
ncbi:MAG: response regulator [Leptolyngbya sp. BL-A-14]